MSEEMIITIMSDLDRRLIEEFPHCPEIQIQQDSTVREKPRHFAAVSPHVDPIIVYYHPDLANQRPCTMLGILSHEAGHIADSLLESEAHMRRICRALKVHYTTGEERRADILGEWLSGYRIYYDPKTLVQKAGKGVKGLWPRPARLK